MTMDLFSSETLIAAEAYPGPSFTPAAGDRLEPREYRHPGYRTKDISFHATMQELLAEDNAPLRRSGPGHFATGAPMSLVQPFEVEGLPARAEQQQCRCRPGNAETERDLVRLYPDDADHTRKIPIPLPAASTKGESDEPDDCN